MQRVPCAITMFAPHSITIPRWSNASLHERNPRLMRCRMRVHACCCNGQGRPRDTSSVVCSSKVDLPRLSLAENIEFVNAFLRRFKLNEKQNTTLCAEFVALPLSRWKGWLPWILFCCSRLLQCVYCKRQIPTVFERFAWAVRRQQSHPLFAELCGVSFFFLLCQCCWVVGEMLGSWDACWRVDRWWGNRTTDIVLLVSVR